MRRLIIFLTLVIASAPGSAFAADALPARKDVQNGVTITVTPQKLAGPSWEFQVVLETHSQDLKDDLAKSATLVAGGQKIAPSAWQGDPPGGHHRKGVLRFNAPAKTSAGIEVIIQRSGEASSRVFKWPSP